MHRRWRSGGRKMDLKRDIMQKLVKWKDRDDRKPLLLTGVRQCGKTYVCKEFGMRLLLGAELNILDTRGTLDLDENYYRILDLRIAGIHSLCWQGGTVEENTHAMVQAIRNPWTQIISHPGDGTAELDFEPVVLAAKETRTLLEINNSSLDPVRHKEEARRNNLEILRLCRRHEVPVILGSDAHISFSIADYRYALPLLAETDFPEALVMNDKPEWFLRYTGIE